MKIVIVGAAHPFRGGIAAFDERLAHQFILEGHDVSIVTFTLQYPSFLFPGKTQFSDAPAPADLKIERMINSCNPITWIKAGRHIRSIRPDVVIFAYWMSFFAPCYHVVAKCCGKCRKIGLVHNMIPHEKNILDKLFPRFFIGAMDSFIAISESVRDDVKALAPDKKVAFSPHPIYDHYGPIAPREEGCRALGLDAEERYMLFFGLIREYKGLDLLLQAMAQLPEEIGGKRVKLVVAGEFYVNEQKYKDMEKSLGLEGRIVWHSRFIPDEQVRHYFNAADIVVQPYKSATQSGITQIAYHFERPMLVTAVGGLPEIVPDGKVGYAVNPEPSAIASALRDFYENFDEKRFAAGLVEEKEKYSWSRFSATLLSND